MGDAGVAGIYHRDDISAVVRAPGIHINPVGEDTAGAVVLGAVKHKAGCLRADFGDDFAQLDRAHFGPAITHQLACHETCEPGIPGRTWRCIEAIFDKCKVGTQCLRDIGVSFGQLDQQLKQLGHRSTGPAVFDRHPHRAKTGLLE